MVYSSTSLKAELVYEVSWFVTYIDSGWKFMLGSYVMFKDTKLLDSILSKEHQHLLGNGDPMLPVKNKDK